MSSYREVVDAAVINLMTGCVPCVMGKAGIGKTDMAKEIAKMLSKNLYGDENVVKFETFVGSLLSEGDLSGLPYVSDNKELDCKTTEYAVFGPLKRIMENAKNNIPTLLFLDEINRVPERSVMNNLMNLILAKDIHGNKLSDLCFIMAAGNPPDDKDEDYQTMEMDPAMIDRMFMYTLEPSVSDWNEWAMGHPLEAEAFTDEIPDGFDTDKYDMDAKIHRDLRVFIGLHNNLLNTLRDPNDTSRATSRGYELFSKNYNYLANVRKKKVDNNTLSETEYLRTVHLISKAKLGTQVATAFVNYLKNGENKILELAAIVNGEKALDDAIKEFKEEHPCKINETILSMVGEIDLSLEKKVREKNMLDSGIKLADKAKAKFKWQPKVGEIFVALLNAAPRDIMIGAMKYIYLKYNHIHTLLQSLPDKKYRDNFMEVNAQLSKIAKM